MVDAKAVIFMGIVIILLLVGLGYLESRVNILYVRVDQLEAQIACIDSGGVNVKSGCLLSTFEVSPRTVEIEPTGPATH